VLSAPVLGYGVAAWGYGSSDFHFADEGWFGSGTEFGGADKLGHAFSTHAITGGLAALHRRWGFSRKEAALRSAISAFAVLAVMEVGDAHSTEYGFAWQDIVADVAGSAFGYFHESSPWFGRVFDFRMEYLPSDLGDVDPVTNYEDSAFLLAANVGALVPRRHTPLLDFVDLQVGYRVRDLDGGSGVRSQEVFVGVGLNVANVLRRLGLRAIAGFFEFYQVPFVSLRYGFEVD
jgi:hypothetical protein